MGFLRKIEEKTEKVIDWTGSILFFLMLISTFFNIFSYWFTGKRYAEFDEIVLTLFVWVVFIACGPLYKHGEHIQVSFIVDGFKPTVRNIANLIIDIFVAIISSLVIYYTWKLTVRSLSKYTQVLKLPYAIIDIGVLFGYISLLIASIAKAVDHAIELFGKKKVQKQDSVEEVAE